MTAQFPSSFAEWRLLITVGALVALGHLSGCSGMKAYPNTLEKNLVVRTTTDSGSLFSKVRASVSIYRVDAQCRTEYEGTLKLENPSVAVGIPTERWSYLVFDFSSSGFLSNVSSSVAQATLLRPRSGLRYEVDVSYRDDIYNVAIRESTPSAARSRELELKRLNACVPG